jgi:CheY-like chemotaxis protein
MDDPQKAGIPIIAMTANAFTEDRQVALDAGMNDHIAKPINMNVLVPTLRKYL